MMADKLMKDSKKAKVRVSRRGLKQNKKTFNMAKNTINLKICLMVWKE